MRNAKDVQNRQLVDGTKDLTDPIERIKDLLLEILARNVMCGVTENGSNFVKAFKIFVVKKTF